ncbi:MAG: hypothetical protein BAJALOKI2v1_450003 [Promethearchaeota archaeon]|nr:MAG: hypothetical protein BAJALOKI2v1_450003 [Candidatus Lokiarchaeota archaeon]
MKKDKIGNIINFIDNIENENQKLIEYISQLRLLSRNEILSQILQEIIENKDLIVDRSIYNKEISQKELKKKKNKVSGIIEKVVTNISKNPAKKVFYLKEFLDKLEEISDKDKTVVLQSLKNLESNQLEKKMSSLIQIFKIREVE